MENLNLVKYFSERPEVSVLLNATDRFGVTVASFLPNLLSALVLFWVGKVVASFLGGLTRRILRTFGFTKISDVGKTNSFLKKAGINMKLSELLASIVYWLVFLVFITAAADVIGLDVVVETLNALIGYVPQILAAVIVLVITIAVSRLVKGIVETALNQVNATYGKTLASVSEGLIIFFGSVLALAQLGMDISIITTNLSIVLAGFVATVVVSFGLGSKGIINNLLASYYVKKLLEEGQEVVLLGEKGKVVSLTETMVIVKTKTDTLFLPNSEIIKRGSIR